MSLNVTKFLQNLTTRPGVYRMLDAEQKLLYVGKAHNLKSRVSSYFRSDGLSPRIQLMLSKMVDIQITVTHTEAEALLLENNLIKTLKPRYNISLRDDKSYPYIFVATKDNFPRITFSRGKRHGAGRYFGPYPSAPAVRVTLNLLQKLFKLRPCADHFFRNRSRPCLQYQIKRCTAPCVDLISQEDYRQDLNHAILFLEGKNDQIIEMLASRMDKAAANLEYETAALYRDQIQQLRQIYDQQAISGERGDLDILACELIAQTCCLQLFCVRQGHNLGNKNFYPKIPPGNITPAEVLTEFIGQYYAEHEPPKSLLTSHPLTDTAVLTALEQRWQRKIQWTYQPRGERARWLTLALTNARTAAKARANLQLGILQRFEDLQQLLQLDSMPERLECFDISHTAGEATVAACVVFDLSGAVKTDYRRFNINAITPGDDYAAMYSALKRRYTRLCREEGKLPDVLLIDGGKGQVKQALQVLEELQLTDVIVVGVAKGADRVVGLEQLWVPHLNKMLLPTAEQPALLLIQQVRDEAHRFAISGHRNRRRKARQQSILETLPGLGAKRRQQLLRQFGGLQGIKAAAITDLLTVPGIGLQLAEKIYLALHEYE